MTKSILRITLLLALGATVITGMCMSPRTALEQIIITLISLGSLAALLCLYPRWSKTDRFISAYHRWASKGSRE